MATKTTGGVSVLFALPLGILAIVAVQANPFKAAHDRYVECMKRKPFRFHIDGRFRLAQTRDPRALEFLTQDYVGAEKHAKGQDANDELVGAHARYLLASLFGFHFSGPESIEKLDELRRKHAKDGDAWLWIKTLALHTQHRDASEALKTIAENKSVAMRAAAITALVEAKSERVLEAIPQLCAELPKNQGERRILISAMASAILANASRIEDETYQTAAQAFVGLMDDSVKLPHSTKILMARHLAKALNVPSFYINPEAWLYLLKSRSKTGMPQAAAGQTAVAPPRLFGIESYGDRICYVIDMSDSMCIAIEPENKPASGPTTGAKPKRKKDPALLDESDIPWHLVKNRFDLAREHTKISIRRLTKEKRFSVVLFGTKVENLKGIDGLVEASPGNIQRAVQELDAIKPGMPKPPDSPDGTLLGRTNLHGGIRRAFALRKQGYAALHEYVDREAAEIGCDTIFFISDGAPSCDDFVTIDRDFGEGKVVSDTEYGKEAERTQLLEYQGPYTAPDLVVEDVRRMNIFRKAQIHCIAIGEADLKLLRRIAEDSMGELYHFGGSKEEK